MSSENIITGKITEESFQNVEESETHYIVTLDNGKQRKLNKSICKVKFLPEQYKKMILERKILGPFNFTRTDNEKFEAGICWTTKPKPNAPSPEGGQTIFMGCTRLTNEDPNTNEDLIEYAYSVHFPSIETEISKKIFQRELTIEDLKKIVRKNGDGLFSDKWIDRKTGKPFTATIKWDHNNNKLAIQFHNENKKIDNLNKPTEMPE